MNDEVKNFNALLVRQVFRQVWIIVGIILLSRFTRNFAVVGAAETAMQAPPSPLSPIAEKGTELDEDVGEHLDLGGREGES